MNDSRLQIYRFLLWAVLLAGIASSGFAGDIEAESVLLRLIDDVDVPARAAGVVSAVKVIEGQTVKAGELLAQVDDAEAKLIQRRAQVELEIAQKEAANEVELRLAQKVLQFSQAELRRLQSAARGLAGSVSQSELDELVLQSEQGKLQIERAQHKLVIAKSTQRLKDSELQLSKHGLEVRRILAPINGVIVQVKKQAGEWIEPAEPVARIVRLDRLRAEGFVKVGQLPSDVKGAKVTLKTLPLLQNRGSFPGKIVFVSPEVDPVNRQVRVWAEIDNSEGHLRPGLRAKMTVHTTEVN